MRTGSLCTGYGGIELALESLADAELVFVADNGTGASKILECRFPGIPNLGDLAKIDWSNVAIPLRGGDAKGSPAADIDILTAGFP